MAAVFKNRSVLDPRRDDPRVAVIAESGSKQWQYLDVVKSPFYEALRYPLFFPKGEVGWHLERECGNAGHISQLKYYRMLLLREARFAYLGRLQNEYILDMFSRVEDEKLNYIRYGLQSKIAKREVQLKPRQVQLKPNESSRTSSTGQSFSAQPVSSKALGKFRVSPHGQNQCHFNQ